MQRRGALAPRFVQGLSWRVQLLVFLTSASCLSLWLTHSDQGIATSAELATIVKLSRADVAAKLEIQAGVYLGEVTVEPQPANSNCSAAHGGQIASDSNNKVVLSFVLIDDSDFTTSTKRLLEVFRTANEVDNAEFLLYTLTRQQRNSTLIQVARNLMFLFGATFVFRDAADIPSAQVDAVELAHGEFLAFVGPSMLVMRGWLSAAIATFRDEPDVGAIGPLILGLGNNISDAGGTLDHEGNLGMPGRGQRITPDMYYMHEVDALTLDCVVIRRQAVRDGLGINLQMLTQRYRGADLAMSLRLHGWRAVLQPFSLAFNLTAALRPAHPGDVAEEAAEASAFDRERLVRDWDPILQDKHCGPASGADVAAERYASPRLLWIDDTPPQPDRDSGSIRALNLLRILLGEGYHVTMLSMHAATHLRYLARLRHMGVRVYPKVPPEEWPLSRGGGGCAFDAAIVSRRDVLLAALPHLVRHCPGLPLVYDTVDLHFLREARDVLTGNGLNASAAGSGSSSREGGEGAVGVSIGGGARTATGGRWEHPQDLTIAAVADWLESADPAAEAVRAARDVELRLLDAASLAVVVSEEEVGLIRRYRPHASLAVVSNSHALVGDPMTSCHGRSGLLFVGNMNHPPNRQAAEAMILDVLPHLLRALPWRERRGLKLHVVASNAVPDDLEALMRKHSAHVVFHGHLDDEQLLRLYGGVKAAVAPLLSGAGVKGKVNQAMLLGVPVVGTPLAMEGMQARDGVDCMVASTPQEFAAKVAQVYTDCAVWERLAQGGYRNVQRYFSVQNARPALLQALSSVGVGPLHGYLRSKCQPLAQKYAQQAGSWRQRGKASVPNPGSAQ